MTNKLFYNYKLGGAIGDCTTDVFSVTSPGFSVLKSFFFDPHGGANKARIRDQGIFPSYKSFC